MLETGQLNRDEDDTVREMSEKVRCGSRKATSQGFWDIARQGARVRLYTSELVKLYLALGLRQRSYEGTRGPVTEVRNRQRLDPDWQTSL